MSHQSSWLAGCKQGMDTGRKHHRAENPTGQPTGSKTPPGTTAGSAAAMHTSSVWRRAQIGDGNSRTTRVSFRSTDPATSGRRRSTPTGTAERGEGRHERNGVAIAGLRIAAGSRTGTRTETRAEAGSRRVSEYAAAGGTRRGSASSVSHSFTLEPSRWFSRLSPSLIVGRKPLSVCALHFRRYSPLAR